MTIMEDQELKEIWAAYDKKLEAARVINLQSWALNLKVFEELQSHKVKSKLTSLANFKIGVIILGIVYVLFLALLVYGNHGKNIFFAVSIGMIALITAISIAVYIKHIVIIKQINYSDSLTGTQEKLAALQTSTIDIGRILWLQLPFWSTFFWNTEWMMKDLKFWLIAFPITLVLAGVAIWLYRNISLKNSHRKWFKILFSSREWTSVIKAMEFMKEIEAFKANL
jgi:hypothetical protein